MVDQLEEKKETLDDEISIKKLESTDVYKKKHCKCPVIRFFSRLFSKPNKNISEPKTDEKFVDSSMEKNVAKNEHITKQNKPSVAQIKKYFRTLYKLKITEVDKENDIKYQPPLSYRGIRIIGWIAMVLAQSAIVVSCAASIWLVLKPESTEVVTYLQHVSDVLEYFQLLPLPLFLLANFALILQNHKDPIKILRTYIIFTIIFALLYIFVLEHYLITSLANFVYQKSADPRAEAIKTINSFLNNKFTHGLSLNVFVDLLICTLLYIFAFYTPEKGFKNNKQRIVYRSLSAIPIIYEIVSFILKSLNSSGKIHIPLYVYPILTNKPLLMFIAYICLLLFIVVRWNIFKKRGYTREQYDEFLMTNTNSINFATYTAIVFGVFGAIDLTLTFADIYVFNFALESFGIGDSSCLLFVVPIVLLFSYTKTHKNKTIDKFLPIVGVGLVVFTYIEGFFQILLSISKV